MAEITIRVSDRVLKVVGALLVVASLLWLNFHLLSSGFYRPKYHLKTYVAEASGIRPGTSVRVDGLKVGTVQALNLAESSGNPERRIELILRVEDRHQDKIRHDSSANLLTEGLFGDRYVEINRGFIGVPLSDGEEIPALPSKQMSTSDFINSVGKFADCLKEVKAPDPKSSGTNLTPSKANR